MALATGVAALSFAPGLVGMRPLPALGHAAARLHSPAMLLDAGTASWIADGAVLLPDTADAAAATAAATAAAADAAQEPGFFDTYAAHRIARPHIISRISSPHVHTHSHSRTHTRNTACLELSRPMRALRRAQGLRETV